jgi:hypothetical protein
VLVEKVRHAAGVAPPESELIGVYDRESVKRLVRQAKPQAIECEIMKSSPFHWTRLRNNPGVIVVKGERESKEIAFGAAVVEKHSRKRVEGVQVLYKIDHTFAILVNQAGVDVAHGN